MQEDSEFYVVFITFGIYLYLVGPEHDRLLSVTCTVPCAVGLNSLTFRSAALFSLMFYNIIL